MRWTPSNWRIFLPRPPARSIGAASNSAEDIRRAMLNLLDTCPGNHWTLKYQIACVHDVDSLWYLRTNLLLALAADRGERRARGEIDVITQMFRGHVPNGLIEHRRR